MLARRLAYVFSALVLVMVLGSAVAQREREHTQAVAPSPGAGAASSAPAPEAAGDMPPEKVLRARVGEIVSITVRTAEPETASIPAIGVSELASADVPATLEFVPSTPGRYPVELTDSGRVLGTVDVSSDR
jgi:hypothetical protein